jgi:26S proteasome regulatory subunit N12
LTRGGQGNLVGQASNTEVGDFHAAIRGDQKVPRFDIPVDKACLVGSVEGRCSLGDDAGFDRNFALLKPYYLDIRDSLPASEKEPLLWGLRLLMLLVQNRIAEFHSTLELLPVDIVSAVEVSYVMELEGWMMQGSYANIGSAKSSAVSPYYVPLLDRIVTTVRNEVASCSQAAYKKLRVEDAQKILDIRADEVDAYCAEYGWKKEGEYILLQESAQQDALQGLPEAERVIQNCMQYAKELERII